MADLTIVVSAPTLQSKVPGRRQITGDPIKQEVDEFEIVLKTGSLPPPRYVVEEPLPRMRSSGASSRAPLSHRVTRRTHRVRVPARATACRAAAPGQRGLGRDSGPR
jgi:hypothetical protein